MAAKAEKQAARRVVTRRSRRPEANVTPSVTVVGFKSLAHAIKVDIAPLTLLCGANSSGKSSVMQPLLLIKQTMEVAYDPGPLLLAGTNVGFSTAAEMFWRGRPEASEADGFSVDYTGARGETTGLTFGPAAHGLELVQMRHQPAPDARMAVLTPQSTGEVLAAALDAHYLDIFDVGDFENLMLKRSRCFFEVSYDQIGPTFALGPHTDLRRTATDMLHLPGLRDNPARFYPATEVGSVFPGVFQPYVASVIQSWVDTKDDRLKLLGRQLQTLGLTWKVRTQRIDDTRVALRVGRLPKGKVGGANDMVNIVDVGLGVSQTLPVLVALLLAGRGQMVFLEQPEIHLHPRAQVALADLLLDASVRGVRVITETHSYLLLRAIQEATVRRGLPGGTVGLNWFSRDADGATAVDSTYLSPSGSFGEWPTDFADVEMDVEDRYLTAVLEAAARSND